MASIGNTHRYPNPPLPPNPPPSSAPPYPPPPVPGQSANASSRFQSAQAPSSNVLYREGYASGSAYHEGHGSGHHRAGGGSGQGVGMGYAAYQDAHTSAPSSSMPHAPLPLPPPRPSSSSWHTQGDQYAARGYGASQGFASQAARVEQPPTSREPSNAILPALPAPPALPSGPEGQKSHWTGGSDAHGKEQRGKHEMEARRDGVRSREEGRGEGERHSSKPGAEHRQSSSRPVAAHNSSRSAQKPSASSQRPHSSKAGGRSAASHHQSSDPKSENRLKRPSTFLGRVKFCNELPEVASLPKWIPLKSDPFRYSEYRISSLEKSAKPRLHLEVDLGIPLDLLDLSAYRAPPPHERPPLDPADAALLSDDAAAAAAAAAGSGREGPASSSLRAKERPTDKGLSWLVHTQYISPVVLEAAPKKKALTEKEAKLLALQLELGEDHDLETREGQIRHIEDTFRACQSAPVHPTNPKLQAVEVLPILPNLERMSQQFVQLLFDDPPLEDSPLHRRLSAEAKKSLESRALMKNFRVASGDGGESQSFVAYMVPAVDENGREKPASAVDDDEEEEEQEFEWIREYHWTVVKGHAERASYLFCFNDDHVSYVPLGAKLTVQKLKAKEGGRGREEERAEMPVPSKITVRKRSAGTAFGIDDDTHDDNHRRNTNLSRHEQEERVHVGDSGESDDDA